MSNIQRPFKTGGNRTYMEEIVNDSNFHIKAAEVDEDLDTIYVDYSGNINDSNIAPGANIATSKIAQDQGLQTDHYADNSVTGAKILDGSITDDDLANDAVTTTKILDESVTLAKLAPGSTIAFATTIEATAINITAVETTILTAGSFTPRGVASIIFLDVNLNGVHTDGSVVIILRLKQNGSTIRTASVISTINGTDQQPFNISMAKLIAFASVAQVFTVTAQITVAAGTPTVTGIDADLNVLEHA